MGSKSENNIPCLELHLGTDLLISAWLMFISALIGFAVLCNILLEAIIKGVSDTSLIYYSMLFCSGFIYAMAGYVFVIASYEENFVAIDLTKFKSVKEMTLFERYFTGNNLLCMAWLLLLATLPCFSFPFCQYAAGDMSDFVFIFSLCCLIFGIFVLILFVISCLPENMILNNGNGSSYVHNLCLSIYTGICASSKRENLSSEYKIGDFLIVTWIIAIGSVFSVPVCIYITIIDTALMQILMLISDVLFAVGSCLFVYTIYPENSNVSIVWYWLCGCCGTDKDGRHTEERSAILDHNA